MFSLFKNSFQKIYQAVTKKLATLFHKSAIDQDTIQQLEQLLLEADVGVSVTKNIIQKLHTAVGSGTVSGSDMQKIVEQTLASCLLPWQPVDSGVIMLVGINGSGKTTAAAKLAYQLKQKGKKVLLVAADTFRAAAVAQLTFWAEQINVPVIVPADDKSGPSTVVFNGCKAFIEGNYDTVIIDTAGRLQTKTHLMLELEKVRKVILKFVSAEKLTTLLTVDSMLGQSSFQQAQIFHESTPLNGIILTKMDGTAKGGIVFAIAQTLQVPVAYVSTGEKKEDIAPFDAHAYIQGITHYE